MFKLGDPSLAGLSIIARILKTIPDTRPMVLVSMTNEAPTTVDYNRFLYEFVRIYEPSAVLELGTDRGRSSAHMAYGCDCTYVVTIDIDEACTKQALDLGLKNICAITADSLLMPYRAYTDVLFIDSLHTFKQARAEYEAYWPQVAVGGIIFLDDIHLDGDMESFWASIDEEKVDLSSLHFSGFGAVRKGNVPPRKLIHEPNVG